MNKVYTFKKEILFKTNIYEILSIAIDKKFNIDDYAIKGYFKINGEYLIRENERDEFDIEIPYLNYIEDNFDISKAKVDIDDFYYEIKDSNHLVINIDILVDGLEEKEREDIIDDRDDFFEDFIEDVEAKGELIDDIDPDNTIETMNEIEEADISMESIKQVEESRPYMETKVDSEFVTYRVCIVRETDTLDSILEKYNVTLDTIKKYNVVNEIKNGDKLIIPYERN